MDTAQQQANFVPSVLRLSDTKIHDVEFCDSVRSGVSARHDDTPRFGRERDGVISAISLSTLSVLPHRVGLRQLRSTPKLMMPPVIGKPFCTSSRIVTALVCYPFAAGPPNNVVFASSARDQRATR